MNPGRIDDGRRDALVAALRAHGIAFYAPSDAVAGREPLTDEALIRGLASSRDPRLRDSLAAVFIRDEDVSSLVQEALNGVPVGVAETIRRQYTAAACLQRMWRTNLGLYFESRELPDLFGHDLGLPSLDEFYGELALRELASQSEFNQLSAWEAVMELLLEQLARAWRRELATAR